MVFQILVETGLVPGVLLRNKYLEFICKNVFIKIDNKENLYLKILIKIFLNFILPTMRVTIFVQMISLKK
jgi:phosphoribosylformylglycinamidine synthase